jgi:hypothetical protein
MFAGEEERQNFSSKHQRENDACFQNLTSFFHPPLAVDACERPRGVGLGGGWLCGKRGAMSRRRRGVTR